MSALRRLYRGENHYDFTKAWRWGVRISAVLLLISVVSLFTRGINRGIDFEGGLSWEVQAPEVSVEDARAVLGPFGLANAKIQRVGTETLRVQATAESAERQAEVRQALAELAGTEASQVSTSEVGPTWGAEVTRAALRALVVFLIAILAYVTLTFRGEWKMAVGVVVAVVHDVLISVGVYSLFQFEVTPSTVVAFLTILGYSIYDTVVVYDKVQENVGRVGVTQRLSYTGMVSLSMNQVLMRSINTSVTSMLPVVSLLVIGLGVFGAVTLGEFGIALLVGLGVGAYSSVFIAAPLLVAMKEREPRYRQLRDRLASRSRDDAAPDAAASRSAETAAAQDEHDADAGDDDNERVATAGGVAAGGGSGRARPGGAPLPTAPAEGWTHPPRPRKKRTKGR